MKRLTLSPIALICREEAARQEEPLRPESIRALPALHQRKGTPTVEALEESIRRNIGLRIELMRKDLQGDVKKLEAKGNHYRLRIGSHRVLFTLEDRKEVYE